MSSKGKRERPEVKFNENNALARKGGDRIRFQDGKTGLLKEKKKQVRSIHFLKQLRKNNCRHGLLHQTHRRKKAH